MSFDKTQDKAKSFFNPVDPRPDFPKMEEKVLKFWKENKIFEKSVETRPITKNWTFLDGPPFITGLPHYGTLLSSIPKDVFPRYKTMNGFRVRRVWGWDCHGLPAENKVENKLGIKRKKDIEEKIGIKKFIDECKLYVNEVSSEWEWYVDHIARWVDFKNAYKTMDLSYMESVMWVFSEMYKKGYIYKGRRVSLYCPHCSTPISNFEVAMDADNYKDITEPSNVYKYKAKDEKDTYFLAWSTTPWNKLATPALAVNPSLDYVKVKEGNEFYILAKNTLKVLKSKSYKVVEKYKGENLVGKKFEPHYDFYKIDKGKRAFVVIGGNFVTTDEGTGIVTIAAYGEEDLDVIEKEGIQIVLHVDEEGTVSKDSPVGARMNYLEANKLVNEDLEKRGLIYREDPHTHSVAHCWRCGTRLFYNPQDAWYVDVQTLKPLMEKGNETVNWFPKHFKHGRFLKSLEAAPDWCISRSRYWGSPVPVWECECGERYIPGSIKELEELSARKIGDLHKPEIDEIKIKCKKCGKSAKRVPEVLDSWIEAGSASFAERHYPLDKSEKLEEFFPPDFIVEYTGQIRAWFYVLHVIATALSLYNDPRKDILAKNVSVSGVILGTDGRKMSKNYGNYPDPKEMLQKYGGDALRLYLLGSPVMKGEDIRISEEEYRNQIKDFILILWNVYNFFVTYANAASWKPNSKRVNPQNPIDRWIVSRMYGSIQNITKNGYENFNTPEIVNLAKIFLVRDLSTWYVRGIRERVAPYAEDLKDRDNALMILWFVLTTYMKVLAPIIPFISEEIYRNLTKEDSIHLAFWPEAGKIDTDLEKEMEENIRRVVGIAHSLRKSSHIPVRQTLVSLATTVAAPKKNEDLEDVLKKEVNVLNIKWGAQKDELDTKMTPALLEAGKTRELVRKIQAERKKLGIELDQEVKIYSPWIPADKELVRFLIKKTLAREINRGDFKITPL
ncbi:isoleucine--tRNA ligase [Candidatus Woesebacteria bacterium]|nr:isoleucine--tRNA ligase [Candidatus Woesebacteria bacterium]